MELLLKEPRSWNCHLDSRVRFSWPVTQVDSLVNVGMVAREAPKCNLHSPLRWRSSVQILKFCLILIKYKYIWGSLWTMLALRTHTFGVTSYQISMSSLNSISGFRSYIFSNSSLIWKLQHRWYKLLLNASITFILQICYRIGSSCFCTSNTNLVCGISMERKAVLIIFDPLAGEGFCCADCTGIYEMSLHHKVAPQRTLVGCWKRSYF